MIEFLLKSAITMTVLLVIYYLLFEKEKMHKFNRFYLLGALVFSLAVPFITVATYIEQIPTEPVTASSLTAVKSTPIKEATDYLFYTGWALYTLVTFLFALRFIRNIVFFIRKTSNNPTVKMKGATLVLLDEKVLPHTFLNYIFVNRDEYETNRIEKELYTHEYTHVIQKHTLDILFIETLKVFFWFNPMLYFYKKAIQLNHEFLADQKVIATTANTIYYQNLLLEKANIRTTFSIASNLTFSLTKKRLLMMTKTTSATKAGLLKLAVTPVLGALMILLCTKTIAQERIKPSEFQPSNLEVTTVTKSELDSLQKTDPVKYKGKKSDFMKTKISYVEEKDKHKNSVSFEKKHEYTLNLSGAVTTNPSKIKSIEILQLTPTEIDSLKKIDALTYNDTAIKEYVAIKIMQMNDRGQIETLTTYERKPKNENN